VPSTRRTETPTPVVSIVDDDPSMSSALRRTLQSAGWRVRCYGSGKVFLSDVDPSVPGCVLLDVRMPEAGGFGVMSKILGRDLASAVIFISGYPDVRIAVRAIRSGAVDFLPKPFDPNELLEAVERAVELDASVRRERAERAEIQARFAELTERERDVLPLLLRGRLNKQIAHDLGISQRTVEVHRYRIMKKTQADSAVELLGLAFRAGDESVPALFRRPAQSVALVRAQRPLRRRADRAREGRAAR
jgi:FixJ family two-component response regulator